MLLPLPLSWALASRPVGEPTGGSWKQLPIQPVLAQMEDGAGAAAALGCASATACVCAAACATAATAASAASGQSL